MVFLMMSQIHLRWGKGAGSRTENKIFSDFHASEFEMFWELYSGFECNIGFRMACNGIFQCTGDFRFCMIPWLIIIIDHK
jgi:hypothetical protein